MTKADVFRYSDIHNKGHNLSIRVSIKWSQFAKPVLLHFSSKGIYSMETLTVLFKGPTAVQRTHIQSVFSVLIQMRICSLFNSPCWHATRKHPVVTPSQSHSLHTAASWHIWNVSARRTKADQGGAGRQATATVHWVPILLYPMFYL